MYQPKHSISRGNETSTPAETPSRKLQSRLSNSRSPNRKSSPKKKKSSPRKIKIKKNSSR